MILSTPGSQLSGLSVFPPVVILLLLCLITSVISAIASNAATTSMLVPVILSLSSSLNINPVYLSLGVTLTASHSFMLPVSTPPNAIVYTAGRLAIKDMLGVGAVLNLLCITTTILSLHSHGDLMFDLNTFPEWANATLVDDNSRGLC